MKLRYDQFTIHPLVPFSISRSTTRSYERVRVCVSDGEHEGWGEAAPNVYYRETVETVIQALPHLAATLDRYDGVTTLDQCIAIERDMRDQHPGDASARSAVSAALHDIAGKRSGMPVWQMLGLECDRLPLSSFTIPISLNEDEIRHRVDDAAAYPILKVKLGTDRDEWIVRTVRESAPDKRLRVDANAAWNAAQARDMSRFLADNGCELLEQPLPPDDVEGLRALTRSSPVPVVADESCRTLDDVERIAGAVNGINIKLSKCGGLAEARDMIAAARRLGMQVMLGCMVESSLGISAAAQLAPLTDYLDLDGAALLSDDPFGGVSMEAGVVRLRSEPGLGVWRRDGKVGRQGRPASHPATGS